MDLHVHNLLGHDHDPHVRRRKRILKVIGWSALGLAGAALAAFLIVLIPAALGAKAIYADGQSGKAALLRAKEAAEKLDFADASEELGEAADKFDAALKEVDDLGPAARLPWFKNEVAALRNLLLGGFEASVALKQAVDVGADVLSVLKAAAPEGGLEGIVSDGRPISQLTREDRRALLQKLVEAPDRLGLARASLDEALAAFDRIPRTAVTEGLLVAIEPYRAKLRELRSYLARDLSVLSDIPAMIGYPQPKTYLFLLLNNAEIRPSGGFVGTYGIVKLADGGIEAFSTDDVYALDGPAEAYLRETPPAPIARYLKTPGWFMRDANWSPDFVVSAMNVERFYRLEGGKEKLDGVIGVTPDVIARLLEVTGPITIEGSTFTSANLADELEYQVEKGFAENGVPFFQRKDVVGRLGAGLVAKLLETPVSLLPNLAVIAQRSVEEKHLMAWFHDPGFQDIADARGWSGRLKVAAVDQLAVIDANLAALKTDPKVERAIAYALRPDGSSWIARAEISYKHVGRFDWRTTRYRTYTRFYAPIGSEFVKGEGMMVDDKLNDPARRPGTIDVGSELGRAVFGGFISIEPGETRKLAVEYRVSDAVAAMIRSGRYRLNTQKQPGTAGHRLTLDLAFGKNVARAAPPEDQKDWGDDRYRLITDLRIDRDFSVDFAK